jgi:phosphoserine phosphatase RsbU/P
MTRVLIVDDTEPMRLLYRRMLELDGFDVRVAIDGPSALEHLAAGQVPDVVLLDYMMPGMSGPEVLRRVRGDERLMDLPVIMLTSVDDADRIEEGFAAGANDYLTKPVDRRILSSRVRSVVLARRRALEADAAEREREHMRAELARARDLQRAQVAVMPQSTDGWQMSGALVPCGEVGGDLFDVIPGRSATLAIIDISGHGMASAMVASSVRSLLRLALRSVSIEEAVRMTSDHLAEGEGGHYACIGLVQLNGSKITVLNAGLPPIALLDTKSGKRIATVMGGGIPPGLVAGAVYESVTFDVCEGARLVMVSDGLTEPFGAADDIDACIGRLGLAQRIPSPREMRDRIRVLFDMSEQPDDATLLVADFTT